MKFHETKTFATIKDITSRGKKISSVGQILFDFKAIYIYIYSMDELKSTFYKDSQTCSIWGPIFDGFRFSIWTKRTVQQTLDSFILTPNLEKHCTHITSLSDMTTNINKGTKFDDFTTPKKAYGYMQTHTGTSRQQPRPLACNFYKLIVLIWPSEGGWTQKSASFLLLFELT